MRNIKFNTFVKLLSEAVNYLHQNNIIHRDLKPSNLIYDKKNKRIIIIDFGLSRLENGDDASGNKEGTPPYQDVKSYEAKRVAPDIDWWAVGMILLEYHLGHTPLQQFAENTTLIESEQQKIVIDASSSFLNGVGNDPLSQEISIIKDKNVVRLIIGLLQPFGMRWTFNEIQRWLNGENVPVEFRRELLGEQADENLEYDYSYSGGFAVTGYDKNLVTPDDLYTYFAHNYPKCNIVFTNNNMKERLRSWVKGLRSKDVQLLINAQIDSLETPDYRGMVIQKILKPHSEIYYRGIELSTDGINEILTKARDKDDDAIKWCISVFNANIFGSVDVLTNGKSQGGKWLNWQNKINNEFENANNIIERCQIPKFGKYYSSNKNNLLWFKTRLVYDII
jgi:serine/threonine protein kinase